MLPVNGSCTAIPPPGAGQGTLALGELRAQAGITGLCVCSSPLWEGGGTAALARGASRA